MFLLRVQANQCKIVSFAICLNAETCWQQAYTLTHKAAKCEHKLNTVYPYFDAANSQQHTHTHTRMRLAHEIRMTDSKGDGTLLTPYLKSFGLLSPQSKLNARESSMLFNTHTDIELICATERECKNNNNCPSSIHRYQRRFLCRSHQIHASNTQHVGYFTYSPH